MNAVPAVLRVLVEGGAGAVVEAEIVDGDDCLPAAGIGGVIVRRGPDRVVMVARVGGVDGDDGDVSAVFTIAERLFRDALGFLQHAFRKFMRTAVLVVGDEADTARRAWVPEDAGAASRASLRAAGLPRANNIAHH